MSKTKDAGRPMADKRSWARTYGTYLSGQAAIDGADAAAMAMETKWGAGRLRLLVDVELRERFDKQRFKFNSAIWHGDLEAVRCESERMTNAWMALDRAAEANGASLLSPVVWETTMPDGSVAALARTYEDAGAVITSGRRVVTYTLDEIGTMLQNYNEVTRVKEVFPGATVERIRHTISDPLDSIRDGKNLEDEFNDQIPDLGQ